ncbi:H-NS histone family protein [Paraburkholderia caribensis]|uniref:H-NS histone family protein n=1 Tax=Paraburkholderia caribensis TaxID=75105 RepID=UPI00078DD9E9|nr:H-NS histone family protein [Paraburkholderia caribensis]AMV48224.1 histone [Paraburkholderia caribensis]
MTTLEKVQARIATLQAQAEAMIAKQSSGVVEKIREIMEKHGLTVADIEAHIGGARKRGRQPGAKAAVKSYASVAKYRDPKSGATWSGRGRAPAWIANTKDRSKFLMDDSSGALGKTQKTAVKAGNYVRGPQAPKYRDPKTGATWSGRGRAPAWLAGAKDQTAFLIENTGEDNATPKTVKKATAKKAVEKSAGVKRATAKKVTTKTVAVKKNVALAKKAPAKKIVMKKLTAKKAAAKKVTATVEVPDAVSAPANGAAAGLVAA